jgi:hypothetical protein
LTAPPNRAPKLGGIVILKVKRWVCEYDAEGNQQTENDDDKDEIPRLDES